MRKTLRENGLSIVLFCLFVSAFVGQIAAGRLDYNESRHERGQPAVGLVEYLRSGSFLEATMENWESEFLQMAAYVLLTTFLFQNGSAESKDPDEAETVDREPRMRNDAPGAVRRGGLALRIYEHSLSLALVSLLVAAFAPIGGAEAYNEELIHQGHAPVSALQYLATSRFWFESFQNWQSEFISIWAMVVFSIFLREKGSPESKPVDAPHRQTGS
jgi:hypothetical protein